MTLDRLTEQVRVGPRQVDIPSSHRFHIGTLIAKQALSSAKLPNQAGQVKPPYTSFM